VKTGENTGMRVKFDTLFSAMHGTTAINVGQQITPVEKPAAAFS
jgi:hypothetical protein